MNLVESMQALRAKLQAIEEGLVGFNPKELVEARPYGDYFDDSGISARPGHDEGEPVYDPRYDRIGAGDPRGSGHSYSSSHHQPKMVGMYFYDIKPGQEEDAQQIGVKKTKSGKWALVQHDTSGATFRHKKHLADLYFGSGKFWSPKNEGVSLPNPDGSYPPGAHTPEKQQELNQWVSQKITVDVNQPGELKRGEMTRPTDSGVETLPVVAYGKTGLRPRFPMGTEQTKGQLMGHGLVDVKIYNGTAYIELP
jgi:hypothetical protein